MDSPNFSNQQQERIYRRLNSLVSPGAAAFWRDACRMMAMEPLLESTTHYVAHSLREIESALRDVLEPLAKPTVSNPNLSKCPSCGHKFPQSNQAPTHKDEVTAILRELGIPETDSTAQTWLKLASRKNEYGLHGRAHRKDLAPPRPVDDEFRQFWHEIQVILDTILDRFETRYSGVYRLLDELLNKSQPTKTDLKILRLNVPHSFVALSYFFERLQYPEWLNLLWKEGFFKNPPELEVDPKTGRILVWQWPQSRYLAAMAYLEPEKVLNIALEILETGTENAFVHEDLAEAARSMPPELAAPWVEKETEWLKEQDYLYFSLPEKLGKLIAYLAQREQVNAALGLARELLAVLPNSQNDDLLVKSRTRCDDYYYQQILTEYVSKLVAPAGEATLDLLCNLLNDAISFRQFPHEEVVSDDRSDHWYPTFEENRQYLLYEARDFLTTAIWKTTQQIARNDPARMPCLAEKLESYQWRIFYRIVLHLLRRFPNEVPDLIAERLADRKRLNEPIRCYEYALLIKERFADLNSEVKEQIITWIEQGPEDTSRVKEEKITLYIKHWQRDWLAILSGSLPREWQQQYEQLVLEIGSAESLEPVGGFKVRQGSVSPKLAEELAAMSMPELFTFLKEWQPTGELLAPSRAGLAGELSKVIAQKPEDFIEEIEQFKEVDPEYMMSGFLRGLQNALENYSEAQSKFSSWEQVIEFCSWMLEQLKNEPESKASVNDLDYWEWNQICKAVIELIDSGLKVTGENQIPLQLRSPIWTILEQLTNDPNLTPGFETYYRYSNGHPIDSLNTIRGKAMHAIIRYALWVKQHLQGDSEGEVKTAQGFDEILEVRNLLEYHLDPLHDSSLTIRSIYGGWLPRLMSLDLDWTTQNLKNIFPRDEALQELRASAWEGYVTSWYSDAELFATLREEYNHAIERIGSATPEWQNRSRADEGLAVHLLDLYWRGELELGESDQLLERFFANASAHNREEFMKQIGRRLHYGNLEVGTDLLRRLQRLWEWRVSDVESTQATNSQASDLKFFSWWFISRKFDDTWAIAQLINTLRLSKALNYDPDLLSHLVALAPLMPLPTVECLVLIAEADGTPGDNLFAFYAQEDYRPILFAVLQSEDKQAGKLAKELINRLLVRGIDFRDLLSDEEV